MSDSNTPLPGEIFKRLASVMEDIGSISKTQTNSFDKYNFRGIDDVYNAIQPALVKHGVVCIPNLLQHERAEKTTNQGKTQQLTTVTVEYKFIASDGSHITCVVPGEGADRGDKSYNKAMTSAYKTAMFQTFCIPTQEKGKDSEEDSPEFNKEEKKKAEPVDVVPDDEKSGKESEGALPDGDKALTVLEVFMEDLKTVKSLQGYYNVNKKQIQFWSKTNPELHEKVMNLFKEKKALINESKNGGK